MKLLLDWMFKKIFMFYKVIIFKVYFLHKVIFYRGNFLKTLYKQCNKFDIYCQDKLEVLYCNTFSCENAERCPDQTLN